MEILNNIDNMIETILLGLGIWGPVLACLLVIIESIIPILPLAVFITINFLYFGNIIGFFISLVFAWIGCMISFYICRKGLSSSFQGKIKNNSKAENLMIKFSNISFGALVTIIALPFTPAFLINIAAGLSTMSTKKFIYAIAIGKIATVYFWGYVGTSIIDSFKDPIIIIRICVIVVAAYIFSKLINKVLKI